MAAHEFSGVWRLNTDQSNIPPVTKSQIITIDTDGFNITMREELINERDELLYISVRGRLDGSDSPVTGTSFADTVSYCPLDDHTIEGIAKKNGRVCVKEKAVLSQDENTIHVTYESYDENGNIQISQGIFERITSG